MNESRERVEFFHSESSFGTQSNLSESRYYDFTNELIAETDNVFLTLKRELLPNQTQSQQEKIDYAMRRAQILCKDTIPEHIAYLNKIDAPANAKQQVVLCQQKLAKLLADHQNLKNRTMIYKQFYNIYGKEFGVQSTTFNKKKEVLQVDPEPQELIKPEYIQINYNKDRKKLATATPRVFANPPTTANDKELANLRQQVYQLKKINEQNRKIYEQELTNQQLVFEKRMKNYLNSQTTSDQIQKNLNNELRQINERLIRSLAHNQKLNETLEEKNKDIQLLKNQNHILKQQIELLRKTDNNLVQYQQLNNKSFNSQAHESGQKRSQKLLKNIMQQNQLLKNQLKTERLRLYRLQSDITDEQRRQLERNRKNLITKREELDQLYSDFDKQRIQILQLSHACKANEKMIELLKRQKEDLSTRLGQKSAEQVSPTLLLSFPNNSAKSVELSRSSKPQIVQYEGDGIEGYPYYEILSKEFKIRFRRACLKEKELLYKSNGIQIGVITNFQKLNRINILIHISNYSEQKFEKVKVKIMNANQNKIQGDSFEYPVLSENQQLKLPVSIQLHQYPIGPLILLLEYVAEKKEEIRILLPAHIFKAILVEQRQQNININNTNAKTMAVVTERKICKDLADLKQYLKVDKISNGVMRASLFHEHTHTLFYLDIHQTEKGVDLVYEHKEGNRAITEYFMKTFAFLISKDITR